jgi:hypothetical protein
MRLQSIRMGFAGIAMAAIFGFFTGCDKKDEETNGSGQQILPLIGPAVNKAKPSGIPATALRGGSDFSMNLAETPADAAEALRDFFTDSVQSISGITKQGWIDAYISDLDKRVAEVTNDTEPACLAATPVSTIFDTGLPSHTITLKLSCARSFESPTDQSGAGSGLAYGRDDTNYYMYLLLAQKSNASDKFGYVAVINRTTEDVQLMFLENSVTWNRGKFFHLKTSPSPKKMEFVVAGTSDGAGPISTQTANILSAGTRFVANETLLRAEGTVTPGTDATGAPRNTSANFVATECFDATNLATTPATCADGAPEFSTTMPLMLATSVAEVKDTIGASLVTMQALVTSGVTADEGAPPPPAE